LRWLQKLSPLVYVIGRSTELHALEKEFEAEEKDWLAMLTIATKYVVYGVSESYFVDQRGQVRC
jgi:hypothetical protein